jgi:hypothetical protein
VPPEAVNEDGIFFASTEEELEAMLAMWGEELPEGEPNAPLSDEAAREFARSLGFDTQEDEAT